MICVHPNLAIDTSLLRTIELEFGLRAVIGDKYSRLVPTGAAQKPLPKIARKAMAHPLCQCSFCLLLTNTQAHGSDCKKCELGVMEELGGDDDNGGKAA